MPASSPRGRHRLIIAASDMRQVAEGARYLDENKLLSKMPEEAARVMWTGLVVTYARPYITSRGLGSVGGKLGKPADLALRTLHKNLLDRRDDLFAHNEATEHRTVADVTQRNPGHMVVLEWDSERGTTRFVETYVPMEFSVLPRIVELAEHQEERFLARVREIDEQLGRTQG
jgi:hypothetical protein